MDVFAILFSRDNMVFAGINILMAWGVYIALMTGQISAGHGAFMAIGAYFAGAVTVKWGLPFGLAIFASAVLVAIFGALVGFPALRVRGLYLVMATIGLSEIVRVFFKNFEYTGADVGLNGMRGTTPLIVWGLVLVIGIFMWRLQFSRMGWAFEAIYEDEVAAAQMGINTTYFKVAAFGLGSAIAAVAGALYSHYMFFIEPEQFKLDASFTALIFVLFGGRQTFWGCALGAAFLYYLPEFLRFGKEWRLVFYSALILLVIIFRPDGLITRATARRLAGLLTLHGRLTLRPPTAAQGGKGVADAVH